MVPQQHAIFAVAARIGKPANRGHTAHHEPGVHAAQDEVPGGDCGGQEVGAHMLVLRHQQLGGDVENGRQAAQGEAQLRDDHEEGDDHLPRRQLRPQLQAWFEDNRQTLEAAWRHDAAGVGGGSDTAQQDPSKLRG